VTEMRFGVDLVKEQIRIGMGEKLSPVGEPRGHSIEVRINAEDPANWFPSLGTITRLLVPGGPGVRLDGAMFRGLEVTPHYDSMLAKLIVHGDDRDHAIARMVRALKELRISGVATSASVALHAIQSIEFRSGDYDTGILERIDRKPTRERTDLALLAAAAARMVLAERAGAAAAAGSKATAASVTPRWGMAGRMERLGRGQA